MNPKLEKCNWYRSKYKIDYSQYKKYSILESTQEKYDITDIIFRYVGDVVYISHPLSVKKKTKIIFNNIGNATATVYKRLKTIVFDNEGDATVYIVGKTACNIIFINRGNVKIVPSASTPITELVGEIIFANEGDVEICNLTSSGDKLHIYNSGDFCFKGIFLVSDGLKFNNLGNVHIINSNRLGGKLLFDNGGDVIIDSDNTLEARPEINFKNRKNVIINLNQYSVALYYCIFKNGGNVTINNKMPLLTVERLEFDNAKDVNFQNLLGIKSETEILFNNKGNVDINSVKFLRGKLIFKNNGDIYSKDLEEIETPTLVTFENGKSINLSNLKVSNRVAKFNLSSGGDVILGDNKNILSNAKNNSVGYIKSDNTTLYSNSSYIKRYNIPVNSGKVILYKAVDKITRTAPYDKIKTVWRIGETIEHTSWNPYDNEIGKGKYVASISPKSFFEITKSKRLTYVAIEIDVLDLYEYPFGKHPQFIGFRRGKVLYEVDKEKNIIDMKYTFAKEFYDYMESNNLNGGLVMAVITNKVRTNKFYYDADGSKQKNPYYDKLYRKQHILYKYGVDYYEERKKLEPDWVPDTKRGTFNILPDNPLMRQSVGTGNVSMSIVNQRNYSTDYFYQDKSGEFYPWDEKELGNVKMYIPNYTYANKDKLSVTIHKYLADSIYSLSYVKETEDNKYEEIKTFYNDDYIYKNLI